ARNRRRRPTPQHDTARSGEGRHAGLEAQSEMSAVATLRRSLHRLSHVSGASAVKARMGGGLRILMFHGIDDEHPPDLLEAQLRYLARHFTIVPLGAVAAWLESPRAGPSNPLALTFDDGLRNQCTQAYPVLRRLGLPATFYVCPGLIEEGRWLWNHEAR